MRKYSGCFLLIVSFLIVIVASIAATEIDCEKSKLWTNAANNFDPEIKFKLDNELRIAITAFVVGIVMFIVGLILVMSRTKDKKR